MALIEFLRVRKAFVIFALIVTAVVLFTNFSVVWGITHAHVHHFTHHSVSSNGASVSIGSDDAGSSDSDTRDATQVVPHDPQPYPISFVFGLAGFMSIFFVSFVCGSLNRENVRGGFAFTKPIARERLALTYFAIDALAILAVFAFMVLISFVSSGILRLAGLSLYPVFDDRAGIIVGSTLGAAFMWYGLLQAVTAARRGNGGLWVGLAWPFFFIGVALYQLELFGPAFHDAIVLIDFINPFAYVMSISSHGGSAVDTSNLLRLPAAASITITWCLGAVGCALAVLGWKRLEV